MKTVLSILLVLCVALAHSAPLIDAEKKNCQLIKDFDDTDNRVEIGCDNPNISFEGRFVHAAIRIWGEATPDMKSVDFEGPYDDIKCTVIDQRGKKYTTPFFTNEIEVYQNDTPVAFALYRLRCFSAMKKFRGF